MKKANFLIEKFTHYFIINKKNNMEKDKKSCGSCNKSSRTLEFTKTEKIYAGISVVIVFFTVYGIIEFTKDIISLF